MLNNYTRTAWRSLLKNRVFTFINVLGLAAGIAAFLFITTYVRFERSYEGYNPNAGNMWRITLDLYNGSEYVATDCETHPMMGQICKDKFPEIKDYVRLFDMDGTRHIQVGDKKFNEQGMLFVDPSAFKLFAIKVVQGDPLATWNEPWQLALSESQAKKFYGRTDVIGEQLMIDGGLYKVSGVFEDVPPNTHLKFGMLMSHETIKKVRSWYNDENAWNGNNEYTYLLTEPGADLEAFNKKLYALCTGELKDKLHDGKYQAETIKSIHLYSHKTFEPEVNGNAKTVSFLSIIALFIIVIAWVNYMNLSTARAVERAKEVGIRKVMGSMKVQLVLQFLAESLIVNIIAGVIAISCVQIAIPLFQQLTGLPVITFDSSFWMILGGLIVFGSLLAGIYPAFVLSSFKPVSVLKGKFQSSSHGQLLRKSLVVFQFATTIILIIGVTSVYMQVKHLRSVDIGSNLDKTIAIRMPLLDMSDSAYASLLKPLKNEVMRNSSVTSVTMTDAMPGIPVSEMSTTMLSAVGKQASGTGEYEYYWYEVDENFVKTMGMTMAAGRDFERDAEFGNILINEEAAHRFGFNNAADAVGTKITFRDWRTKENSTVVGVVKNFYQLSPKEEHIPMVFVYNTMCKYLTAHLETTNVGGAVDDLKNIWAKNFPGEPFTYFFTDDNFDQQYRADVQFGEVMATFSVLTVIIACLGLFGLSSYTILQRRKEIGIRKVLGASISQVVTLLSGGYLKIILVSSLLALPVAWLAINNWLSGYTVRINMTLWMFVIPVILILATALVTVSFQTIRSALINPAKSLKEE
jgi:putative ABC transport system permease protein